MERVSLFTKKELPPNCPHFKEPIALLGNFLFFSSSKLLLCFLLVTFPQINMLSSGDIKKLNLLKQILQGWAHGESWKKLLSAQENEPIGWETPQWPFQSSLQTDYNLGCNWHGSFFFLMWTTFKVFIEFFTIMLMFGFLVFGRCFLFFVFLLKGM